MPAPTAAPPEPPVAPTRAFAWPPWLARVLVESALIVFSVLLALAVDAWREGRADRERAATARTEILAELQANRAAVAEALQYHNALMDSIAVYRAEEVAPTVLVFQRGFVAPAQLSHTAWSSAVETGALSHMDYPTVLRLSGVYAQQDHYQQQVRSVAQILYGEVYAGGTNAVVQNYQNLGGLISTFSYRERQLLDLYDRTLAAEQP